MSVRLERTAHRLLFALVRARRARRRTSRSSRGRTVMMVRSPLAGPLAIIVAVILLANLARVYAPRARTPLPLPVSARALARVRRARRRTSRSKRAQQAWPMLAHRAAAASAQPARPTLARAAPAVRQQPRASARPAPPTPARAQQPVHSQRDRRSRASRVGVGCAFAVSKRSDLSHAFALHQRMRAESTC